MRGLAALQKSGGGGGYMTLLVAAQALVLAVRYSPKPPPWLAGRLLGGVPLVTPLHVGFASSGMMVIRAMRALAVCRRGYSTRGLPRSDAITSCDITRRLHCNLSRKYALVDHGGSGSGTPARGSFGSES